MMKSSSDNANDNMAAATMPGTIKGSVTRTKVRNGGAPRSIAASSSVQSRPRTRARTVSATKLTSNAMWAMTIVPNPRFQPRSRNSVSSDAPITISGAVRQHEERLDELVASEALAHERNRHQGAQHDRDRRRQRRHLQACPQGLGELGVAERIGPVVERESPPGEVDLAA